MCSKCGVSLESLTASRHLYNTISSCSICSTLTLTIISTLVSYSLKTKASCWGIIEHHYYRTLWWIVMSKLCVHETWNPFRDGTSFPEGLVHKEITYVPILMFNVNNNWSPWAVSVWFHVFSWLVNWLMTCTSKNTGVPSSIFVLFFFLYIFFPNLLVLRVASE